MSERDVNGLHAWLDELTHRIIHHAAGRAPPDLSARLEEEWRADLAVRSSTASRLQFALGCCWATRVISREHGPVSIPVPSTAIGMKVPLGELRDESGILARRSIAFFVVAGLHIALFYGLMTGLAFKIIKVMPTSFQARLLQPPQEERALPPLPPPQLAKTRIEIPPPYYPPTEEPAEDRDIIAASPSGRPDRLEAVPSTPPHEVSRVLGGPGSGFPTTDDYYPSLAKRMEEQGVATVHVCVGADGRLMSEPTIAASSGSARLDDGALLLAKAGSGHYRPNSEDGHAVNSCYSFRVRFALRTDG